MMSFKTLLKSLIDLLFPPRCLVCRRLGDQTLCDQCLDQIRFLPCQEGDYLSVSIYEGVIKRALQRFKFKNKRVLANPLGKLMANYVKNGQKDIDIIVPVPLHKKRLRERGFNQCQLLGQVVSEETGILLETQALLRIKHTSPQFKLKSEERSINLQGAFQAIPEMVQNKKILLIDDILTTGATIRECRKALKSAGAGRVEVLSLSKTMI